MPDKQAERADSHTIRAVIDRIEDNKMAVLMIGEDGKVSIDLPVALLPAGASDGDHLRINITLDADARSRSQDKVREMQERLTKRSGGEGKKEFKL